MRSKGDLNTNFGRNLETLYLRGLSQCPLFLNFMTPLVVRKLKFLDLRKTHSIVGVKNTPPAKFGIYGNLEVFKFEKISSDVGFYNLYIFLKSVLDLNYFFFRRHVF
jgi:hypothetical protein